MTTEVTSGSGGGLELQTISSDVGSIQDEDVLRRMWQQTEDFGQKKEIRARMYKLREQRLKDFYTTGEVLRDLQTVGDAQQIITKKTATSVSSMTDSGEVRTHGSHAESIHGQGGGFMSLKSKEIRDSESPTRDLHKRQQQHQDFSSHALTSSTGGASETTGNWKVVRESSSSAYDSTNNLGVVSTSSRSEQSGTTQGKDGLAPQGLQLVDAGETVIHNPDGSITRRKSTTYKASSSSTSASQQVATQRAVSSSTASSRTVTTAKSSATSSATASSDQPGVTITEISSIASADKRGSVGDAALKSTSTTTSTRSEQQQQSGVDQRIMTEISKLDSYLSTHNATGSTNTPVSPRSVCSEAPVMPQQTKSEFVFESSSSATASGTSATSKQESRRVTSTSKSTTNSTTSNDLDATRQAKSIPTPVPTSTPATEDSDRRQSTTVIEQQRTTTTRLENEKRAAEVSSSKQQTTTEPSSTVITTTTTTTKREREQQQPQQRPRPREVDADQYVTTYQQSYNSKRISEDLSPTHQYFASALRASPAPSSARATPTRSLDRETASSRPSSRPSSPRKSSRGGTPDSSRASPAKDRPRVSSPTKSTTSTTTFDSSTIRRSSATSKDKRRFTSSASRAAAKKRSGTPGASPRASPRTSPVRARSASPASSTADDSDAFVTSGRRRSTSKTSVSSSATWTRDLTRKSSSETLKGTSKETSPLRDDVTPKASPQPTPTSVTSIYKTTREKSPEYSSDGSLASELFQRAERGERRTDKDASPDRFTPIKAFRTIPEGDVLEPKKPIDVDTTSTKTTSVTTKKQTDSAAFLREETRRASQPGQPRQPGTSPTQRRTPQSSSVSPCTSPERSPVRPTAPSSASPRGPKQPARSPASSPERSPVRKPQPPSQPAAGRKPATSIPRATAGKPSQPQRPRDTSAPSTPARKVPGQRRSSSSSPERPKQQSRLTPKRPIETRTPSAPTLKRPLADKTNLRSPAAPSAVTTHGPTRPAKPAQQPSKSAFVRTGSRPEKDNKPRTASRTPSSHRLYGGMSAEVCGACHLKLGAEKDTVQCTSDCKRKFHVRCVASGEEIKLIKLKKNWRCVRCGGEPTTKTTTTVTTKTTVSKTLGRRRSSDTTQRRATNAVPADSGAESDRSSAASPPTVRPVGQAPSRPSGGKVTLSDMKTTTTKESRDRIDLASLCGVVIEDGKEIKTISTGDYYSDLENEAPPEEFLVDDDDDLELDTTTKTKISTKTTKRTDQNDAFLESERRSQTQQRTKDLFSRTSSDRNVLKKQTTPTPTPKRQTSKPELSPTSNIPTSTTSGSRPYGGTVLEVCGACHLKLGAEKDTVQCTSDCKRKFHVRCVASGEEIKLIKLKKNWRCVRCGGEPTDKKTVEKENSRGKLTIKVDNKNLSTKVEGTERRGSTTTTTTTTSSTRETLLTNGQRREESFTSGDETDVPNADKTATPTGVDSYMWELEDMRRRQEEQYARKVTDKENILLNADVHVQLPKSSRESSPDARGVPGRAGSVCTAGDESDSSRPRYADRVSEPGSDEEGPGPRQGSVNKLPQLDERRSSEQRELERDGLEEDENDVANLSVSDKVNRFMESSRTLSISELKTVHRPSTTTTTGTTSPDHPGNVSKAKALFENIASGQQGHKHDQDDEEELEQQQERRQSSSEVVTTVTSTSTPQQIDVLSRPSIFDGRKVLTETTIETTTTTATVPDIPVGVTIAKDTLPRKRSPSPEPPSYGIDYNKKPEPKQTTPSRANVTPSRHDSFPKDTKTTTSKKTTDTTDSVRRDSVRRELFPDTKKTTTTSSTKTSAATSFLDNERSSTVQQRAGTSRTTSPVKDVPRTDSATTPSRTTSPVKDVTRKDSATSFKDLTKRGSSSSIREVTRKESSSSLKDITRKESSSSITRRESASSITKRDSSTSITRKDSSSPTKDVAKKSTPARSPSPTNKPKQLDILSRPSIFEGRKMMAAKEGSSKTINTTTTTSTTSTTRPEPKSPTKDTPVAPSFSFLDRPTESSLARVNKFGVHLRSTASSSTTSSTREQRRPSAVYLDDQELNIEEVFDIEFLETILERVVGYEQRRRIRTQIRKAREQAEHQDVKTSTKTSTSKVGNTTTEKVRTTTTSQSPTSKVVTTRITTTSTTNSGGRKSTGAGGPSSPTRSSPTRSSPTRSSPTRSSPERSPSRSPDRFATRKSSTLSTSKSHDTTERRRSSATATTISSSMRASSRTESSADKTKSTASLGRLAGREAAREACPTDSITSSYGVGPTDDRGRPLFGLKALRRTNTNRTLEPEPASGTTTKQTSTSTSTYTSSSSSTANTSSSRPRAADITDSSGLPLFGGLRALKISSTNSSATASEQNGASGPGSPPLRDLVQRHEQHARDSLLDSSRRGILKKPRDEGVTTSTSSFSRSTVVSQRQVVGPDGTVSLTRDVIRGETVSKPGQEPVTNVSREHFAYETPEPSALSITQLDSEDEEVRRSGSRKSSPSPDRVLIESAQSSKRSSRNFEEDTKFSSSFRRSSAQDDFIQTEKAHSTLASQNGDEVDDRGSRSYSSKVTRDNPNKWSNTVSTKKTDGNATTHTTTTTSKERRASGGVTSESTSVSSKSVTTTKSSSPSRKSPTREVSSKKQTNDKSSTGSSSESKSTSRFTSSSRTSTSRNSSSSNIERRRSSATADDVSEEGSSTVTSSLLRTSQRGSVRALQEKFQKAAADANSADTARSNRSYPKAGLIFRSASFRSSSGDGTAPVTPSSPNPPSTPLSDLGTNPTLKQSASMEVRVGSPVASPLPSTPSSSETRSFLNDRTAVTDVHDVLTRMRNADIVVESGDSAEDQAARSLLNKFLGASVILQGMEPLVSDRHTSSSTSSASARQTIVTGSAPASTTSAALVSQVERQRLSGAKVTNGSASDPTADLDSIWDEAHLRSLLDVCSDYEGRRKIRARLRTVMAEQKACEGVVAAAQRSATDESRSVDGDTSSASSVHGESLLLPYLVEHLRSSLQQQQQLQLQQQQELRQQQQARPRNHLPVSSSGHAIEDSGTESGEDLRFLAAGLRDSIELHRQESSAQLSAPSQPHGPGPGPGPAPGHGPQGLQGLGQDGLLDDVQSALSRLEASLLLGVVGGEKVDTSRQESLLQLVNRLKSSLGAQQPAPPPPAAVQAPQAPAVPPRRFGKRGRQNRHTVGVSQEELADARRFLEEAQAAQAKAAQVKAQPQQDGPVESLQPAEADDDVLPAPIVVSLPLTRARSPYQLQKQSSAGDVPACSLSASTFRAFRPTHFIPKKFSSSAASTPPNASVPASASASGSSLAHSESVQDDVRSTRSKSSSQSSVSRRQAAALKKTPQSSYSSIGSQSNEDDDEEEDDEEDEDIDEEDEDAFVAVAAGKPEAVSKVLDKNANLVANTDIASKDYDPSKKLFTAAQSVQIAVHKAAINKQLSVEEQRRSSKPDKADTSEESDVTESVDEETEEDYYDVEDDDEADNVKPHNQSNKGIKPSDTREPPPGVLRNQTFTVQPTESIIGKIQNTNIEPRAAPDLKSAIQAPNTVMVQNPVYIEDKAVYHQDQQETKINKQWTNVDTRVVPNRQELDRVETQSNASDTSDTLQGDESAVSSAQRLLKMATNNEQNSKVAGSRFSNRSSKKQKMKRANTIDIPKPLNYYQVEEDTDGEVTSGDEAFHSAHDSASSNDKRAAYLALRGPIRVTPDAQKGQQQQPPAAVQAPKTENDRKFLAFLEQQGGKKGGTGGSLWSGADDHNGSASPLGGHGPSHQWNNRFSNIKTAFENNASHSSREQQLNRINSDRNAARQGGARSFWQTADDSAALLKSRGRGGRANGAPHEPRLSKQASAFLKQLHEQGQPGQPANKLPWAAAEQPDDPGVVVGSLTVAANNRQQHHHQQQQQKQHQQVTNAPNGPVNKFFHAPMSAFKPIEKSKPTPSAPWATPPATTGSVKQLAAQKFEQPVPPPAPPPEKPAVVHAPKPVHPHHLQPQPQHQLPPPEHAASPLSPTLPWKKDLGHSHHLTSTLAKFESMSSRETSPQLMPVMRSQSQDRIATGLGRQYPQPPQPPPRAFIPAPSTGTVQSRTQTFSAKQAPALPPVVHPALPPHNSFVHGEFSTRPGFGHGLVHSKSNQYVPTADLHWHHQHSYDSDSEDLSLPPTDNKLVLSTLRDADFGGYESPSLNAPPIPTFSAGVTVRQSVFGLPSAGVTPVVTPGVTPSVTPTVALSQAMSTPDSSPPPPYGATPEQGPPVRPPRLLIQDATGPSGALGTPEPEEHTAAVARVMGGAQCQKAVTVTNKMRHRYDDEKGGAGAGGGGMSSAAFNLTNVLHKFSSEEDISPKPTGHMQQQQPPQQQQQQQQQPPQKQHSRHAQPHAQHASKQPAPRLRSEPNVGAVTEAARTQAHQSNGGSPMTSVRPSPVGTPYGTPYSNQSQSPVGSGTEWSSNHHHSPVSKHQPAKAKPVDAHQEARTQSSRKYAETRVGDKAVSQSSPRSPAVTSRSRTSSTDSLILSMSTEELQDSGESVVTTRLQIPVNKVADTIQRYQAHTQAHSQGQDIVIEQRSPSVSPNPGNVLRKSESWHQLAAQTQGLPVKGSGRAEGRPLSMHGGNGQDLPPAAPARSPGLAKAKSSHSLAFPKQFEAAIKPDALQVKQKTVEQYFKKADSTAGDGFGSGPKSASVNVKQQYSKKSQQSSLSVSTRKTSQTYEPLTPVEVLLVDDNLENVDEAFESLFAASVGSDGRTLSGKANYKQRRLSNKPKLGGYSANVTRTSSVQGGSAIKSSK